MAFHINRQSEQVFETVQGSPGLETALLVGRRTGSVHMELSLCRLAPGAGTPPQMHAFEESWFMLGGGGTSSVAHVTYGVTYGSFGMTPVGLPESRTAGEEGMTWLRMRAPLAQEADPGEGHATASTWSPSPAVLVPDETDPRTPWAGQWTTSDMGPRGPISMPGYHGPNIKSIAIRMLVDQLLGAQQHTHFMVEFGPRDPQAQFASPHYHPFEEGYHLLAGSAHGVLDGEHVEVSEGDTIWTGVGSTHGFYTTSEVPLRWLEVQTPAPPTAHAFYFPHDWEQLRQG